MRRGDGQRSPGTKKARVLGWGTLCQALPVVMRVLWVVLIFVMLACSSVQRAPRAMHLPGLMLWAWQRPEDLTFIDRHTTGVAYLAGTVQIARTGLPVLQLRLQPLSVAPNTAVLAVVRIESTPSHAPVQMRVLIEGLKEVANARGVRGLQIDFDARASERRFYRSLLDALHAELQIPVGVTALASWCEGDPWLDRAPIAEAVPMFFRMGKKESREMTIRSTVCGSSIGLSTDELWPRHRPAGLHRIYLFSPRAWTRQTYLDALQRLRDWA